MKRGWLGLALGFGLAVTSASGVAHAQSAACQNGLVLDELTGECVSRVTLASRMDARAQLTRRDGADAPRDYFVRNVGIGSAVAGYSLSVVAAAVGLASSGSSFAAALLPVFGQPIAAVLDAGRSRTATSTNVATMPPAVAMQVGGILLAIAFGRGTAIEPQRITFAPTVGGVAMTASF